VRRDGKRGGSGRELNESEQYFLSKETHIAKTANTDLLCILVLRNHRQKINSLLSLFSLVMPFFLFVLLLLGSLQQPVGRGERGWRERVKIVFLENEN
jgi:hypothetical protein